MDATAPTLISLTFPSTIDLSSGSQTITASVQAQDNAGGSGVDHVVVFFDNNVTFSYGAGNNFNIGGYVGSGTDTFTDSTPTTANHSLTLTASTNPGVYHINQVWVIEVNGNQATYNESQLQALGINTSFTVTGSIADTTAPTLISLTFPSTIDLSSGSQTITASVQAQDNAGGSGVDHVVVLFDNNVTFSYGAGNNFNIGGYVGSGTDTFTDSTPTTANHSLTLTAYTNPGLYHINQVWVVDVNGNKATYNESQLLALGINTSFTVTDGTLDTTPPTVTTFSPSDAAIGVALSSDIVLTFSEAIQKGVGTVVIHRDSATGPVVASYDAATSGNLLISGNTLTIHHSDLANNTHYFVTLDSGSIKDIAGNSYAGTSSYDFTTVAPAPITPTVHFDPSVNHNNGAITIQLSSDNLPLSFPFALNFTYTSSIVSFDGISFTGSSAISTSVMSRV